MAETADAWYSPQRLLDWLRAKLIPRLRASRLISDDATDLLDELLRADRDPDRANEKLDD
jgi:hypothetical protein